MKKLRDEILPPAVGGGMAAAFAGKEAGTVPSTPVQHSGGQYHPLQSSAAAQYSAGRYSAVDYGEKLTSRQKRSYAARHNAAMQPGDPLTKTRALILPRTQLCSQVTVQAQAIRLRVRVRASASSPSSPSATPSPTSRPSRSSRSSPTARTSHFARDNHQEPPL